MLQNPIRRVATLILAAALAFVLVPGLVLAHAELDTPTPADKSTVTTPVTEVSGTFVQRMKVDGSTPCRQACRRRHGRRGRGGSD